MTTSHDAGREAIARMIALAGLGTITGQPREPHGEWTREDFEARILTIIPTHCEQQCFALADRILEATRPPAQAGAASGEHRLCPWCAARPILIAPPRFEAHYRAGCGNDTCDVKPFAKGVTIANAWQAWDSPLADATPAASGEIPGGVVDRMALQDAVADALNAAYDVVESAADDDPANIDPSDLSALGEALEQVSSALPDFSGVGRAAAILATQRPPKQAGAGNARDRAIAAMRAYVESAGVPIAEFDPEFVVRMMAAMMVSFHKYGRVADAYPLKFDAASDVRARMKKYRETGNRHYLVDAANFAMIEAMHPSRASEWAGNDAADSPGRTTASGHRLVQEDNAGNRIIGETILYVPGDEA